jgi:hypothetical protein
MRGGFAVDINVPVTAPLPYFKIEENPNPFNSDFHHQNRGGREPAGKIYIAMLTLDVCRTQIWGLTK